MRLSCPARLLCIVAVASVICACGGGGSGGSVPTSVTVDSAHPSPTPVVSTAPTAVASHGPTSAPTITPSHGPTSPPTGVPTSAPSSTVTPTVPPPTPTPSSTPAAGIPRHIATYAFDEYNGQGSAGTAAEAQTYLTYAEGGLGNVKAVNDCAGSNACFSVFYFDSNFVFPFGACEPSYVANLISQADESWFLHEPGHTDSAHRLIGYRRMSCKGVEASQPVYALNQFNPAVGAYIESYLVANADAWDFVLMDETSGQVSTQLYGPGGGMCQENPGFHLCTTSEEYPNDASVLAAHHQLFSGLTHSNGTPMNLFFNGITMSAGKATDLAIISDSSNVHGGICEDCVDSLGVARPNGYASILNAMAEINAIPNGSFIEENIGNAPRGSAAQIADRLITVAMAWLGYSPGHTVVFPDLEFGSADLAVWPEYNIVPTNPVESMNSSSSDIQVSLRVYAREFRTCYNFGSPIGQCAAIVNANPNTTVTVSSSWLKLSYGHVVQLSGGDISSGGQILLTSTPFNAATATLAPGSAILLVR